MSEHPEDGEALAARVVLRPVGSPLTIGMSGLAVASLGESGLDLHWIAQSQSHELGLILLSVPFVSQLIACVFSYLARDGATGAATGLLSTSWLALGLVNLTSAPGSRSGALGLMLVASGCVLALTVAAIGSTKPLPAAAFGLAGLRFVVAGIFELGTAGFWQDASGIIGLVAAALAGYCVFAFELEGQRHRAVVPTFRRGTARDALYGGASAQLDGVINEPGVRQTT